MNMGEIVITVVAAVLAAFIFLVYPTLTTAEQNEKVTQLAAQQVVSDYVNKIATKGVITASDYDAFIQKLNATGNTFDVNLEVQILDTNSGDKTALTSGSLIGTNDSYSIFLSSIQSNPDYDLTGFKLKQGDTIVVKAKNTNTTIAQQLRQFFYKVTGQEGSIAATASAMVVNNGGK
ncbi:MAG: hypothetical protein FWC53_04380 [Firmicutes bacterium]|nr:hypothetical protein [Bacillota bacterium]